jgi:hypothetical protein
VRRWPPSRSRRSSASGPGRGLRRRSTQASGGVAKVVSKRRKALPLATEPAALGFGGDDGSCYLQLRSRMLFKAPSASPQKGISGWMELIATVEEASTMKAGGENSCIVAMPVL